METILISGANGFFGSHLVRAALARGYRVRALVREPHSPDRVAHLQGFAGATERLEIVPGDLLDPSSLDQALKGCSAVLHAAAAVVLTAPDRQRDIVDVAVEGTRHLLESSLRAGVRRFVMTSSDSAVTGFDRPPEWVFTEEDWCDDATLETNPYGVAKRDSERLLWDFAERHPELEAVALCPGWMVGEVFTPAHLRGSMGVVFDVVNRTHPGTIRMWHNIVDVGDVVTVHLECLTRTGVQGKRYLIMAEGMWWRDVALCLQEDFHVYSRDLWPWLVRVVSWFDPRADWNVLKPLLGRPLRVDAGRAIRDFQLTMRPAKEALLASAQALVRGGYAGKAKPRR